MALARWQTAEPILRQLASNIEPLDRTRLRQEEMPDRIIFHEVAEGETLASVVQRYLGVDLDLVALWNPALNPIELTKALQIGSRIKLYLQSSSGDDDPSAG